MELKQCVLCGSDAKLKSYRVNKGSYWKAYINHDKISQTSELAHCPIHIETRASFKQLPMVDAQTTAETNAICKWNSLYEFKNN
jgi:hypothetical protein